MGYGPVVVRDEDELSSDSEHTEDTADQLQPEKPAEATPGEDGDHP